MSSYKNVITAQGAELIRGLLTGNKKLIFTRAVGGSGACTDSELPALTALPSENQALTITSMKSGSVGPVLGVRVSSNGLNESYTLKQIGVYAKLDDNGTETLLLVTQNEPGTRIPAQTETTGMTLDLSIGIAVDIGDAAVMIDSSAYVTTGQLQNTLCDVVRTRNRVSFSVVPGQWINVVNDDLPGLLWQAAVSNDLFSEDYSPQVFFYPASFPLANQYGVSVHCDMENGKLILYAQKKPEAQISGEVLMLLEDSSAISGAVILNGGNGIVSGGAWGDLFPG